MDRGTLIFAALLVALSLALLAMHWNTWRQADHGGLAERERDFFRRQFRRRIQASGMLGLIGLVMASSLWLNEIWQQALLWSGVLCALVWLVLIAILDGWSSRTFYGRDQAITAAQIERLKKELRKDTVR